MDEAAFGAVERAIRGWMTANNVCGSTAARETVASKALEALIGEKVVDLAASRRCPHCGTVGIVKHGRDENGQQRFRCRLPLGCGRTFNALTNTPLARMRKPEVWLAYAEALGERRSLDWVHEHLGIARLDRLAVATPASNSSGQRPGADAFGHRRGRRDLLSAVLQRASWLEARQSAGKPTAALPRVRAPPSDFVRTGARCHRAGSCGRCGRGCPGRAPRRRHRHRSVWLHHTGIADLLRRPRRLSKVGRTGRQRAPHHRAIQANSQNRRLPDCPGAAPAA